MFPGLPGAHCALLMLLVFTPMTLAATPTPWVRFEVAPALGRQAAREAEELARFAQVALGIELDFSLASLPRVKHLTAALRAELRARPHEQAEVLALVDRLGSYLGEVYRREYGGTWGRARMAGGSRMALKSARGAGVWCPPDASGANSAALPSPPRQPELTSSVCSLNPDHRRGCRRMLFREAVRRYLVACASRGSGARIA